MCQVGSEVLFLYDICVFPACLCFYDVVCISPNHKLHDVGTDPLRIKRDRSCDNTHDVPDRCTASRCVMQKEFAGCIDKGFPVLD